MATQNVGIYDDGELYDLVNEHVVDDIPFYQDVVISGGGGDVLELACGSGRITLSVAPFARSVTGLDASPQMLEWARAKAAKAPKVKVDWREGDMSRFQLGRQFDLVLIPYNAFHHLLKTEQALACLRAVAQHLKADGRLMFDIFNPSLAILSRDGSRRRPIYQLKDAKGRPVVIEETNKYDEATQINHITWYYTVDGVPDVLQSGIQMRQFFPQEMDFLLQAAGFTVDAKYGYFDKKPFTSGDMKQIFICRRS
jgi:SAM-dependent methyltransferase